MSSKKLFYIILIAALLIIGAGFEGLKNYFKLHSRGEPTSSPASQLESTPAPTPPLNSTPTPQPQPNTPKGIYLMVTRTVSTSEIENILSKPFVDGALVGAEWNVIEPSEGNYDWSTIDQYLEIVKSKGKKATLVVMPGDFTPEWVYAKGVQKWNWVNHKGENVTYPNPTDAKFYDLWINFVKALGQRYSNDSAISQVNICGGTGALCGLRFYVLPPNWNANFVVEQWKKVVDAYVTAFPKTNLFFEIQTTKGEGLNLSEQMLEYNFSKYGRKIGLFQDFLSSTAPTSQLASIMTKWGPKSGKSWCAFQQARAQGADLDKSYGLGFNDIGCQYFEVYKTDLTNSAYDAINQKWHDLVWK